MFGFSNIIVAEPRRESGPTRNLRPWLLAWYMRAGVSDTQATVTRDSENRNFDRGNYLSQQWIQLGEQRQTCGRWFSPGQISDPKGSEPAQRRWLGSLLCNFNGKRRPNPMKSTCLYYWPGISFISNRQWRKEGTFCASELVGIERIRTHAVPLQKSRVCPP